MAKPSSLSSLIMALYTDAASALHRLEEAVQAASLVHLGDLPAYSDAALHSASIDDRQLVLERALQLMSALGRTSSPPDLRVLSRKLEEHVIDLLYKDLPHPPATYLALSSPPASKPASPVNYPFRSPSGADYNPLHPTLGQARTAYARSVSSTQPLPPAHLPPSSLVFDTLLLRDTFTPHPGGISALFFAFADLVIHSIFNTSHLDSCINNTSSYLDLSILYGNSDVEMDAVRRKDGTGRLWNDTFADPRLLFMPPASCALLVLLSRNHNYVSQKLLDINERGTYTLQFASKDARLQQDDEIFHRSRLVNCGLFMQIILGDYVGAILGLVRDQSDWRLDPLMEMRRSNHEVSPRGEGNVVSVEFNLLYRWHATLSLQDTAWTSNMFQQFFPNKDLSEVTVPEFNQKLGTVFGPQSKIPAKEWTFNNLSRDADGCFPDAELARILHDATEHRAGAFKARGIPASMRLIEILGIEQARKWGTCSLNEFRKFIGLKPYATFKEWNNDESIANAAEALYHDIDNLELHVGMQAEQAKEPGPGAGLCPGYTISRAILADAVCLTRGDRFLTVDFTPANLTSWGYQDCQFIKTDGSYGGMLTKLLFRTLPAYYPTGSAYAHFPFLDPLYMHAQLPPDIARAYIWKRPAVQPDIRAISFFTHVLATKAVYKTDYRARLESIIGGSVPDNSVVTMQISERLDVWAGYFEDITRRLIQKKSYGSLNERYFDVVHILNALPIRWICEEVAGIADDDLYTKFATVSQYVFLNRSPADQWHLRALSTSTFSTFKTQLTSQLNHLGSRLSLLDAVNPLNTLTPDARLFLSHLLSHSHDWKSGILSPSDLATSLFCELVPTAAHFSAALVLTVDYYLDPSRAADRAEIVRLRNKDVVKTYVKPALVATPLVSGIYRTALKKDALPDGSIVDVDQNVFASIFEGETGMEEYGLLAPEFFEAIAPRILSVILSLPELGRGPGLSGQIQSFRETVHGVPIRLYQDKQGRPQSWPTSLTLRWVDSGVEK